KGNIIVSASNVSAKKVGGDVYDFAELADGRIGVLIGDVSGKGVSAALYMAKIISEFRYIAHMTDSPEATFEQLNARLFNAPRGMFLTAAYSIIDTETGNVTISVAGHPPFLWITDGKVEVMSIEAGPPLGIMPVEYQSTSLTMKKGDRLLFLTDGAFDAKNSKGERLGFDRFVEFVSGHVDDDNLIQSVCSYVDDFEKSTERADDLTFVEIRMV
ncbi:MAG TPA: serine/threonine-protein phosphatase, partial [Nitrospirae bacterium]|nr:serine/threonine-protein phosphatase [Nitrospirota bacterium]